MFRVNEQRFLEDLHRLAAIGLLPREAGGGRDRRAFSEAEREARELFAELADAAGLRVETDTAGNLFARLESGQAGARTLMVGSHMDTVPNGGAYDGALGVIAGLEALRVLKEAGAALPFHLACVAFTDEEGRYCGLTGSQLAAGTYSRAAAQRFYDAASGYADDVAAMGAYLPEAFTVDNLLDAKIGDGEVSAFVELHIEQGPQLEHEGVPIGVVEAIFGRVSSEIVFAGRSDHAGTTPMRLRRDALVAASRFVVQMTDFVRESCPGAVLTCGKLAVEPGADNVVAREARLWVEYRANSSEMLDGIEAEAEAVLRGLERESGVSVTLRDGHRLEPRAMDASIRRAIEESCGELGYSWMTISSGALHDAHSMSAVARAGMIFVPSIGGRSHCPEEDTAAADLVAGANVLVNAVARLAEGDAAR